MNGRETRFFMGHAGAVKSVAFSPNGKYILTGSADRTTKLWYTESGEKELATLISLNSTNWVITTPSGLFDASPGAMKLLHYVVGLEVIDLEQLKERYYEPGLLSKIMGFTPGGLRPVDTLNNVALYPEIDAAIDGDRLHVQLQERNGGIGRVALFLDDNIELEPNANPDFKPAFDVDLARFSGYFFPRFLQPPQLARL